MHGRNGVLQGSCWDSGTRAATSGHAAGGDTPGLDGCGLAPRTEWHKEWHTAS